MSLARTAYAEAGQPLILLGAGGHARVLLALARAAGREVTGVCDPQLAKDGAAHWQGLPVLGDDTALARIAPASAGLLLGIGQLTQGDLRRRSYEGWRQRGFHFPTLVHPAAWVADDVELAEGVQVMAGAVIQPGCRIGENTIINTHAAIDHDCSVAAQVHVAPGATLCGTVHVHEGAFIGAGATVIQGICVGEGAVIGAGVTLVRNAAAHTKIIGSANRIAANQKEHLG